ncbi:hypothetical protein BGZ74_007560 [Mortierella antarctica]|nr:hypothetical protein BGZ74_007560 [Mortierella antarctica]
MIRAEKGQAYLHDSYSSSSYRRNNAHNHGRASHLANLVNLKLIINHNFPHHDMVTSNDLNHNHPMDPPTNNDHMDDTSPPVIPPTTVPNRTTGPGVPTTNSGSVTSITLGATPTGIKTTDDGGLPKAAVIGIGVTAALIVGFVATVMVYKTRHRRHKALGQDDLFDHLPIESPKPPPPPMGNIHHLSGHHAGGHQAHHNHNHNNHHHETDNLYNNSEYHHHDHYHQGHHGDQGFNHHGDHQGYDHHYDGDQGTSQHHPSDFNQAPNQGGHSAGGNQGFSGGDGGQGFSGNQGFSGDGQGFGNQGFGGNQGGGLDQLNSTHNQTGFEGHHGFDGHQGFDQGSGPSSGQGQGFGNGPSGGQGFSNGPSGAHPQGFTPTNQPFGPGPSQPTGNVGGAGIGSMGVNTGVNFGHVVSTMPPPPAGPILDYKKPPLAPRPDSTITSPTLTAPLSGLEHRTSISSVDSSGNLQSWDGDSSHTHANNTGYSPQSKQNLLTQVQAANYSQDLSYVRPPPANASPRVLVSPAIATIPPANVKPMVRAPQDRTSSDAVGAVTSTGNTSSLNTFDRRHPQLQGDGHHESLF